MKPRFRERDFNQRAVELDWQQWAREIRREADGRVCCDCLHFGFDRCDETTRSAEIVIRIARPTAVACRQWEER